jgi:hypothetical protein
VQHGFATDTVASDEPVGGWVVRVAAGTPAAQIRTCGITARTEGRRFRNAYCRVRQAGWRRGDDGWEGRDRLGSPWPVSGWLWGNAEVAVLRTRVPRSPSLIIRVSSLARGVGGVLRGACPATSLDVNEAELELGSLGQRAPRVGREWKH